MQARIATKGGFDEIGDGNRVLGQGLLHGLPEWYPEDVPGERDSPAECDDFRIDESREFASWTPRVTAAVVKIPRAAASPASAARATAPVVKCPEAMVARLVDVPVAMSARARAAIAVPELTCSSLVVLWSVEGMRTRPSSPE